jgi:hypothetical protein
MGMPIGRWLLHNLELGPVRDLEFDAPCSAIPLTPKGGIKPLSRASLSPSQGGEENEGEGNRSDYWVYLFFNQIFFITMDVLNSYSIEFKGVAGRCVVGFNATEQRVSAVVEMEMTDVQLAWFWAWCPCTEWALLQLKDAKFVIKLLPKDLSFACFWDAYGYKVGNKGRAERIWKCLPDTERVLALGAIPKYKYHLATKTNMEMLYAETYLTQKRFLNF